jgi:aspartate/tyrosine/aromatic aminotransferase
MAATDRIASIQTLSGTGACHMAAVWLEEFYDFPTENKDIYISRESWFNHYNVRLLPFAPVFLTSGRSCKLRED